MAAPRLGTDRTPPAGLPVGRFFGVPLYLSPSWLLIALLITLTYEGLITETVDDISPAGSYAVAFLFAVLLAASLLAHELGHTAVSLAFGMPVRRVVIFLLGGVSEIEKEPSEPSQEYLVAVAGPLVSLVLAAGSACFLPLTDPGTHRPDGRLPGGLEQPRGRRLQPAARPAAGRRPAGPGRCLAVSGSRLTGTRAAAWGGRGVAVLVLVGAVLMVRPDGALGLGNVLLASLLAAFIWVGATQSLSAATVSARMPAVAIGTLVRPTLSVPPDLPVAEALRRAWSARCGRSSWSTPPARRGRWSPRRT